MLVVRRLTETSIAGMTDPALIKAAESAAIKSYGTYAMPQTLFNIPTTLIYPFAISALPALSKYYSTGERDKAEKLMESTFRMASIVALPCALGMSSMARPILSLLYPENPVTATVTNIDLAAPCLMVLGMSVFFLGMISVTNSVLQAYRCQNHTIISTVCGIIVKCIASYILLGVPEIGLAGAAIGTALCYLTILVLNMVFIAVKVGYFPSLRRSFIRPFAATIICIVPCLAVNYFTVNLLGSKLSTIASIGVAAVVYVVALLLLKGIAADDIKMLPKSEKILKILRKARLISE
jgi:stage V sporulation protein B